ncbi:outer membrane beta-barrel protein, partial [Flavobacteriales bacterium]|nr:outer membrane beta-barrel protein [Flavobacteriales bacterium]
MKQLIQIISIFLFVFFAYSYSFAQKGYYDQDLEMPFQPRFTLGSGYYSSQGDIVGPKANSLLGNIGFKAGMRLNVAKNTDISLLFTDFKLSETSSEKFSSELNSVGLHLDYTFNNIFKGSRVSPFIAFGLQSISYKTTYWDEIGVREVGEKESTFSFPIGLGIGLEVSERIKLAISLNYISTLADIDMNESANSDNMILADFTIHYDFFTLNPPKNIIDDSYYSEVNFKALDLEDEDGDLVPDIDDACSNTPQGVDVDATGCPLDNDNDGIPNYLDKELNTEEGSLVDENGVKLTDEKYQSMYGYEAALRTYADVYNLDEINKGDYHTINDYLIAKANTYNKAFNEGENLDNIVKGLRYKVQIAKYNEDIPEDIQILLLSINDLESIAQDDGYVLYVVGSYSSIEEALGRSNILGAKGFDDIYFLVDNNGSISEYKPPTPEPIIDETDKDTSSVVPEAEEVLENSVVVVDSAATYRVQIGAYEVVLSKEIFSGISNVIHMKDKDGFIKYMTGSFSDKKEAIDYMFQMRARGFEDAFVVAYQNGKRTIEYFAPLKNNNKPKSSQESGNESTKDDNIEEVIIQFTVQILVASASLDAENLKKMTELGNMERQSKGPDVFRYFIG